MPRIGLLLSGVTPLSGVLHQLGGGVMLLNWCRAVCWGLVGAVMEEHFPRRGLLASGIALLGAAMHCLVASAMPSYLVQCPPI